MSYWKTLFLCVIGVLLATPVNAETSICYGSTSSGRIEKAVALPTKGPNFVTYSYLASAAGRTYVHSSVYEIILGAYKQLEVEAPDKVYKYAETGFKQGGRFKPHKTHQNGLSVDFMTPVVNDQNQSVHLPTNPFNKLGYNIEFDENSRFKNYQIDYEALALHLKALHQVSIKSGYDLWRVIFDPQLQPKLFDTKVGAYLKQHIEFSKKRSWVRHDEHYHVDFKVPCR